MSSNVKLYISGIFEIKPLFINSSIIASPKPFISIASFDAKWIMLLYSLAGHSIPIHLNTASPSSLTASPPQTGHTVGISKGFSSPVLFSFITSITSGITSPAFWITTVSPTLISFSFI